MSQCQHEIAQAARKRAERVVASGLGRLAVPRQVWCEHREMIGEVRQDIAPHRRAPGHTVDQQEQGPGTGGAVSHVVAVEGNPLELEARVHRQTRYASPASRQDSAKQ